MTKALTLLPALLLIGATACARTQTFEVTMQDSSMEPTFEARTVVQFRPIATVQRGEIIAFEYPFPYPGEPRRELIARVIGLPGDELRLGPGGVAVNGQSLAEPYAKNQDRMAQQTVRVPAGTYFVLGDDRANQRDSRWWGALSADKLLGVRATG